MEETALEKQDRERREEGFSYYDDAEDPPFTDIDYQILMKLRESARQLVLKGIIDNDDFSAKLSAATSPHDIMKVSRYFPKQFDEFVKKLRESGCPDIPDEDLMSRLTLHNQYEGAINFIITDGGEIRQDQAFEEDGNTPKTGWKRLYWK